MFITGRRQSELDKAVARVGRDVTVVQGDLADLDDLDRLFATVKSERGGLDVIVSSAGFIQPVTLEHVTPEHFDKTFGVNAGGTFFLAQKALGLLRDGRSIVLISSTAHRSGVPVFTTYAASKAAMRSFARTWAADLKERNIRVNVVSPGPVDTPIIDVAFPDKATADAMRSDMAAGNPMGRIGPARGDRRRRAVPGVGRGELHQRHRPGRRRRPNRAVAVATETVPVASGSPLEPVPVPETT